jgi:rare lipoprotein A
MYAMTAAHKTLPLGTYVSVRHLNNQRAVEVRINDRGPFVRGRIIDLSYTAAKKIGIVGTGTAPVEIVALGKAAPLKTPKSVDRSYVPVDYSKGNFTIQVGAFSNRENARRMQQRLDRKYKNVNITTFFNGNETLYRVRVGRCSTLEQAEEYERIMIENGFKDAMIVAE